MHGLVLLIVFLTSLMATASLLVLIAVAPPPGDPGTRLFLYPLVPLFFVSFLGFFIILHTISIDIGYETAFFEKAVSVARLWLGLGWVIFCKAVVSFSEPFDCLSEQEMETVLYLSAGMGYKEIASMMAVSVASVQTYVLRSYRKLHVHNRKQLNEIIKKND